jgi:hypothetical protein
MSGGGAAIARVPPVRLAEAIQAAQENMARQLASLAARGVFAAESNETRVRTAACVDVWRAATQQPMAAAGALSGSNASQRAAHVALAATDVAAGALPHMEALSCAVATAAQDTTDAAKQRSKLSHAHPKVGPESCLLPLSERDS